MAIKDRTTLKGYFVKNAIPTQEQFADFIDSTLLRSEDSKIEAPLELEASGASGKEMIKFYGSVEDEVFWSLSLESVSKKQGFTIRRGGEDRLFIDAITGNVGIGTDDPLALLDVDGDLRVRGTLQVPHRSVLQQEEWRIPELLNSWRYYGSVGNNSKIYNTVGYYKDSLGIVHLRGVINGGANGTEIFRLDEGYRPEKTELLGIIIYGGSNGHGKGGRIDVTEEGKVIGYEMAPGTTNSGFWNSLDGVSFRARP